MSDRQSSPPHPPVSPSPPLLWPTAIVLTLWLFDSAIHTPVPAVNEPQYLGKARHLWDPSWAAGDFFLDSSNPHWGFYASIGWLTRLMPMETAAWGARFLGYALLAYGWTRLARTLFGSSVLAIPAAGIFLLLASLGNLSGEWIVGGIEGKVFSYACLFAGMAAWLEHRRFPALAWLGFAITFHPIVGAWGLVCGGLVEICVCHWLRQCFRACADSLSHWRSQWHTTRCRRSDGTQVSWRQVLMGVGLLLICAAPGLIPALLTLGGASSDEAARATFMQVFIRLRHHLDPTNFSTTAWLAYAAMLAACGVGWWKIWKSHSPSDLTQRNQWFAVFVLVTVLVALVGTAIGWHVQPAWTMPYRDLRGFLLKFYPFRLADVFIPLAFAFLITRWLCLRPGHGRGAIRARSFGLAAITLGIALTIPAPDANPTSMPPRRLAAWLAVAEWAEDKTPPGTVIVTPTGHWGFRWYANRAEYVNYKDAPQDAAGLLEWERRLAVVRDWWESSETGRYSQADLNRLGRKTGADYLVTIAMTRRFDVPPVYDNGTYRVYRLGGNRKSGSREVGSRKSEVGLRPPSTPNTKHKTQNTKHQIQNPSDKSLPARHFV